MAFPSLFTSHSCHPTGLEGLDGYIRRSAPMSYVILVCTHLHYTGVKLMVFFLNIPRIQKLLWRHQPGTILKLTRRSRETWRLGSGYTTSPRFIIQFVKLLFSKRFYFSSNINHAWLSVFKLSLCSSCLH